MSETINLYLGFDPGGVGSFGWSVCREVGGQLEPPTRTGLANNAWDALNRVGGAIADIEHQGNARVLAAICNRVAQAALRVSDLWFTLHYPGGAHSPEYNDICPNPL